MSISGILGVPDFQYCHVPLKSTPTYPRLSMDVEGRIWTDNPNKLSKNNNLWMILDGAGWEIGGLGAIKLAE